jgi:hypothetical protein
MWTIAERNDNELRVFDRSVFYTREDARRYLRIFKKTTNEVEPRKLSVRKLIVKE